MAPAPKLILIDPSAMESDEGPDQALEAIQEMADEADVYSGELRHWSIARSDEQPGRSPLA
jgi:hypothetical protein